MSPTDEAEPWWAEGLQFACTGCGKCCKGPDPGFVFIGEREIKRIAKHLDLELDDFGRSYLRRVHQRVSLTEEPNGDCVFWEDERGCSIYRARPDQCRQFPFWPEQLVSEDTWANAAESCPGMDKGRTYSRAEIEAVLEGQRGTRTGPRRRRLPTSKGSEPA